jgi:NAD(P)-dependent dehydrogenase (short-subunit alcohol dehydrogenase family)
MDLAGKRVVVTGAASGIGRALVERFAADDALVTASDVDVDGVRTAAQRVADVGGRVHAVGCDVRDEHQLRDLVAEAEAAFGPVDLFCSNAGIAPTGGPETANEVWARTWEVNFLAHLYAVRAVLPGMLERGDGYLLHTASAAGLLTSLGDAPYSVTKHAVVAFAEWLAITYGDRGIKVSALCPQGVDTPLLQGTSDHLSGRQVYEVSEVLEPERVADVVVEGLATEQFLILPHPQVADYFRQKAGDYDRWLRGMRRFQARLTSELA